MAMREYIRGHETTEKDEKAIRDNDKARFEWRYDDMI
jgi:hypothetical protein